MTKSATRVSADKVTFTQTEVTSAVALKAPIASPVFTGNVGIGATPESTNIHSSYTSVDISRGGAIAGHSAGNGIKILGNAYRTTSGYAYKNTDKVSLYANDDGIHQFAVAASGTADAAISWNTAMTIDNAGIVTKPYQPAFRACKDTGDTSSTGYIVWNASKINVGGHYSTSTGKFTAPVAGNYYFAVRALTASATQNNIWIGINHNGNSVLQTYHSHINHSNISGEAVITMAANDYVQTYWGGTGSIHTGGTNHHIYSFFQGHLIG